MEIADLNLSVRAFNAVCRAEIKTVPQLYNMYQCESEKLRLLIGNKHFEEIGDALAKHREAVWEENRKVDEPTTTPNSTVIVSETYTRAVTLTRSIIANAQAAQQSLYEVCKGLKEMRDGKLYKELGYQNFEDYTENEVGIKKVQAYKYVAIATNLKSDFVHSSEQIGTTKLALLAKLDEPTRQEVTETVDVESVTVRELKAQITALTQERDEAQAAADKKDKQFRQAMESKNNEIVEVKTGWKRRSDMLMTKIKMLQDELKAAKMEPQEVAVEDTSRVEELERQLAKAQSELADATAKLNERQTVQMALPGDGGERRRGEYAAIINAVSNAMDDLMDFLEDNDHCSDFRYFANRAKEKLREYNSKVNDMLAKEEHTCQ
jgi:hypothetical protein